MMAMCCGKVDEACVDTNFLFTNLSQARYRLSLKSEAFDYLLEMTNLRAWTLIKFVLGKMFAAKLFNAHIEVVAVLFEQRVFFCLV